MSKADTIRHAAFAHLEYDSWRPADLPSRRPLIPLKTNLSEKTILVTGGTSRLGRAIVQKARRAGARVFFTYHQDKKLAGTLARLGAHGFSLDLSDMRAIDRFVRDLKAKTKGLDVLIHNAALVRDRTIQKMSEEEWDTVLNVNLKAPYYLTQKLLPLLRKKTPAKILMITSRAAFSGGIGISNYAAAKAGLVALTRSLARELGAESILVNAVNPGFMKSKMTEPLPAEILRRHLEESPLGRYSNPGEVADFLIYLCSDQMTQVTGQVFHFESRNVT